MRRKEKDLGLVCFNTHVRKTKTSVRSDTRHLEKGPQFAAV